MGIDASGYPKNLQGNYCDAVENFVNSLELGSKMTFWLTYKEETSFVNWSNAVNNNINSNSSSPFDHQRIIDFIDDYHLALLTES